MKERPILFSGAMVRAILSGGKTQTRRVVKPLPEFCGGQGDQQDVRCWGWMNEDRAGPNFLSVVDSRCPYGQPGDRLWVRETHFEALKWRYTPLFAAASDFIYRADYEYREELRSVIGCHHWKPSIFMKREASRISLEIVSVRVERLQDISEADAVAEGIDAFQRGEEPKVYRDYLQRTEHFGLSAVGSYRTLWESINGAGSWSANPWVWVVEFKRL